MTSIVPFIPSNTVTPAFFADLDGRPHRVVITWNVSAQRYYINVYDTNGLWIITVPIMTTPPARSIASLVFDPFQHVMVAKMVDPQFWPIPLTTAGINISPGTMVDYTLEQFQPFILNRKFRCLQIDELTFTFPIAKNPGPIIVMGNVSRMLNMVNGVFKFS